MKSSDGAGADSVLGVKFILTDSSSEAITLDESTKVTIDEEGKDNYTITETYVPDPYSPYKGEIKLEVGKKLVNHQYVLDKENTKVTRKAKRWN